MIKKNISLSFYLDGKPIWWAYVSRPPKVGDTFVLVDGRKVEVLTISGDDTHVGRFDLHCQVIPRKRAADES